MNARNLIVLTVLGAIWGMSYVFIRVAAPVVGPALLIESRFLIAVAGTALVALFYRGFLRRFVAAFRSNASGFFAIGLLSGSLPMTLIAVAELRIDASLASIINATVPFTTLAIAMTWLGEPLSIPQGIGAVLGFFGVVLAVGGGTSFIAPGALPFVAASLFAAVSYGVGAVFARKRFPAMDALPLALGLELTSAAWLVVPTVATFRPFVASPAVVGSVLGLGILSTAVAYLLFFRLLKSAGPTQTLTVTFLSPVFGVVGGHLLLGEPIGIGLVAGLLAILVGVALVTRARSTPGSGRASSESASTVPDDGRPTV